MLLVLVGGGKIHKLILPKVVAGNYIMNNQDENSGERLIEIEAKDGQWKLSSDSNAKIINPKCINITQDDIKLINSQDLYIKSTNLHVNDTYGLVIGKNKDFYILCCLSVYSEDNWFYLNIKRTSINIGSSSSNQIVYKNVLVPDVHARIFLYNGRWMLENYDKKFGTYVNGELVYDKLKRLSNGDSIFIMGLRVIIMQNYLYICNSVGNITYDKGSLQIIQMPTAKKIDNNIKNKYYKELYLPTDYFYRSPRISRKLEKQVIKIVQPPTAKINDGMPIFLSVGSTLLMGIMSVTTLMSTINRITNGTSTIGSSITSLISSLVMIMTTLLIPLATMKWQKKREKEYEAKRQKRYSEYIKKKKTEILEINEKQRKLLLENYDTTEKCADIILNKAPRLWERTIQDEDFLSVNIGIGDVPLDIEITYPEKKEFSMEDDDNLAEMLNNFTKEINTLKNAPVIISLTKEIMTAYIDKNEENIDKFMRNLLIQLMAFQSYNDLKLVFLLQEENLKRWEYIKLLPYVWNDSKDFRFVEDNVKEMEEISKYLDDEFKRRQSDEFSNKDSNYKEFSPYYLIITDNYRRIENLKIINKILTLKDNIGFSILCIANDIKQLPNQCKSFITVNGSNGQIFNSDQPIDSKINFKFNNSDTFFLEKIVKKISNIPIKFKISEKSSLPDNYSFLEMYNVGLIEQLNILERWKNNDATISLAAPIGINEYGNLIKLDLHEKFHGPHGLIAGSTGSGKSEFIITYILSLAINYAPDDVTFILIDYKGGGLAGAFQKKEMKLPHLVGTITNIDKEGLERSLISIQSEMRRRQIAFNEAREKTNGGVIDIYKYQKLYHDGVLKKPIPHLLIICDEFAELKMQQPKFMSELVSVSRIGRSLGVHLILATQKPSGIVDEQIRSNSKFSICLKVQDKSDSSDVIDRIDAAYIKQSVRFYITVGNDDYFELGQSGWSGAPYYPANVSQKQSDDSIKFISNTGTIIKKIDDYEKKTVSVSKGEQLTNIVKEMCDIALREDIKAENLWLDDISEYIYVDEVKKKYNVAKKENAIIMTIGEYDDPANQRQGVVSLNLLKSGNVIIYGRADSGKETLMSTIVYDLMSTYTTEDLWMYILDFGTKTFKIFNDCPHVGEVIFASDKEKIVRFFTKIKEIVNKRKQFLADYNGDFKFFLKTSGKKMPLIVVLINEYESFTEVYDDTFEDTLLVITREAEKVGITFVISTNSTGDMRYRMSQNFRQKIALLLNDYTEYSSIFEGLRGKKPAEKFGRGFVNLGDNVFEFQTAKPCVPEEYNVFIKSAIEKAKQNNKIIADKIPVLPDVFKKEVRSISEFPLGLRKKDIRLENYNFKENPITVITAKDYEDALKFGINIWEKVNLLKDIDLITLDSGRDILSGKNALSDNCKQLLSKIQENSNTSKICFIFGLEKFMNFLEECQKSDDEDLESIGEMDEIIEKCTNVKNINFIIVEVASKIKGHAYDEWYQDNVIQDSIIWVGDGINDQYVFDVNMSRKDIVNECGCSFGYINRKNKTMMLKLLEMKEKKEDDDDE